MNLTDGSRSDAGRRAIRTYVLRGGRVTKLQQRALDTLSNRFVISPSKDPADIDVFGERPVVAEIGFGTGLATAMIARDHPETGYLGIEVFRAGVGKLLSEIERLGLSNVRIVNHDANDVMRDMVAPGSLHAVHLFFPDPWPKKRHNKRRIVQPSFVSVVASRLCIGGYFYAVTDWPEYADRMREVIGGNASFYEEPGGSATHSDRRPVTRFEARAVSQGREVHELFFRLRRSDVSQQPLRPSPP